MLQTRINNSKTTASNLFKTIQKILIMQINLIQLRWIVAVQPSLKIRLGNLQLIRKIKLKMQVMEITHQTPHQHKLIKLFMSKMALINQKKTWLTHKIMEHKTSKLQLKILNKLIYPLFIRTLVSLIYKLNNGLKLSSTQSKEDIRLMCLQIKSFTGQTMWFLLRY
jgi:hypothetical protein